MTLNTTGFAEDALDSLVQSACHDGFADWGGSSGALESFTDEFAQVLDKVLSIEPQGLALSMLQEIIEDHLDNQDES